MPDHVSPTVRRRRLAAELRRLRERAGLTNEQVAEGLGWSPSKLSRYELAKSGLRPPDVRKVLAFYKVSSERQEELLALAQEAEKKGWWEHYSDVLGETYIALIGLEDEAASSLSWHIDVIPGLLQTEDYARQLNSRGVSLGPVLPMPPDRIVERSVEVRMERQKVLTRESPLKLSVLIDEAVLMRGIADRATMRGQMQKLAEISELPNVSLRIVPLRRPYPIINSFDLLAFGDDRGTAMASVVFTEHLQAHFNFDGEFDIYYYQVVFANLAESALGETESRDLVGRIARSEWFGP